MANAFGTAFLSWQATVKVPGFPWYPPFAAFPGPVAPPTPNVPTPLAALTSVAAPIQALPMTMTAQFGDPAEEAGNAVCRAIGSAIGAAFTMWLSSTMVTNVLGTGPVPTWAPPMVPVGPVVGGVGNVTPGGLT